MTPINGVSHLGKGLTIGYFAQHQVEMLRHDESPLWHLVKIAPNVREQELRNFLGSFNFPGTMVTSPIKPFSGGEKARLALALIVWQRPNLLLLDEPTNHLDLETREALTDALAQFEGTVLLVSHDRHLLRATTDQFIIVENGQLKPFDGDLDDYKDWLLQQKLNAANALKNQISAPVKEQEKAEIKTVETPAANPAKKRNPTQRKAIETKINKLSEQINTLTAKLEQFAQQLADSTIYEEKRQADLKSVLSEQAAMQNQLETLEGEWLILSEELDG